VRLQYDITRASMLAGVRASTDLTMMGLWLAVVFGATMAWSRGGPADWTSVSDVWGWVWPAALAGVGFAGGMLLVLTLILWPVQVGRLHRQNPLVFGQMELEADDARFAVTGPRGSSAYAWRELHGYRETPAVFVVALSKSMHFAIPKAGMAAGTVDELRAVLAANLRRLRSFGLRG